MGYTPFKMKGPSLYRTPAKDNGKDKDMEETISRTPKKRYTEEQKKYLKDNNLYTTMGGEIHHLEDLVDPYKFIKNKNKPTKEERRKQNKERREKIKNEADDKRRRERIAEIDMMKEWSSKKDERAKATAERDRKNKEKEDREKERTPDWIKDHPNYLK